MPKIINLNQNEIEKNIINIVNEYSSENEGISKTEVARKYTERHGNSQTTIWEYMLEMIESGKIVLRQTKKKQKRLFIP